MTWCKRSHWEQLESLLNCPLHVTTWSEALFNQGTWLKVQPCGQRENIEWLMQQYISIAGNWQLIINLSLRKRFAVHLKYLTPSGPNLVQPARLQLKGSHEIWYKVYEKIWHNLQIKSNQLISCNECCTECTTLPQILLSIKALLLTKSPIARGTSLYNYWSGRKSFLGSICPWNC